MVFLKSYKAVLWLLTIPLISVSSSLPAFGNELVVHKFLAKKPIAQMIWFPSEYGVLTVEKKVASNLAEKGASVVIPDFFESYFLPVAPSSLSQIPEEIVARLIDSVQVVNPQLPLFIVSSNFGAAYALKALFQKQRHPVNNIGLILLNPNLYVETPSVGKKAEYWAEVSQLNFPVYIMQAELSPWKWQLSSLVKQLQKNGSSVFAEVKKQLRDRYYFREDASDIEIKAELKLADNIISSLQRLSPYMAEKRQGGVFVSKRQNNALKSVKLAGIVDYEGEQNLPLSLVDIKNKMHHLTDYQGKVVLLNFWATWCPPCVHEIPSMVRLKKIMKGEPFEVLAVNLGEEPSDVARFLEENKVNFPVLLDPKGTAIKDWKVFAYPSSYLIDKTGRIRSAKFGGYEWDIPVVKQKIYGWLAE